VKNVFIFLLYIFLIFTWMIINTTAAQDINSSMLKEPAILNSKKKSNVRIETSEIKKIDKGELRIIQGIPFLKVSGSYYEMGEQYGNLLKDKFKEIYKELLPYKNLWQSKLPEDIHIRLENLTHKDLIQQLKGMAVGSGIPFNDLLLGTYLGIIERGGCSSILIKIRENDSQRLIHGRNYDYGKGTGKFPVVIEYNPHNGLRHLIIGTVASAGLAEGMNEKGITVSGNLAPGDLKNNLIQNTSPDMKLREILISTSSLEDVEVLMERYTSDVGYSFTIGSAFEREGIIYDLNYDNVKKNYFNGQNFLFATNGFVSKELNPLKDDLRYKIIESYMIRDQVNSIDAMIKVLSDPGKTFGVNNPSTIHSVVFDAQRKNIYMAFSTKFAAWSYWLKFDWGNDSVSVYKDAEEDKILKTDNAQLTDVHIIAAYWDGALPNRKAEPKPDVPHFWILINEWLKEKDVSQLYEFSTRAARELTLKAQGHPDIKAVITKGTITMENLRGFMFKINDEDFPKMVPDISYTIHIENVSAIYKWIVEDGVSLVRPRRKQLLGLNFPKSTKLFHYVSSE